MRNAEISSQPRTVGEWRETLASREIEALEDYGYRDPQQSLTPNEVFEIIVEWNGGIATAYHIKSIISRVYGLEL